MFNKYILICNCTYIYIYIYIYISFGSSKGMATILYIYIYGQTCARAQRARGSNTYNNERMLGSFVNSLLVACVLGVGVGIPSSLYTAPVKGGRIKGGRSFSNVVLGGVVR